MSDVLLTAAAAAIILAVVGGGAKAFGVEVPVFASRKRQLALAFVGVGFFAPRSFCGTPATAPARARTCFLTDSKCSPPAAVFVRRVAAYRR